MLGYLNISADKSNEIPDSNTVQAISVPVTQAKVVTEVLLEDKVVPITGFTKAMVKTMTEALVNY